MRSSLLLATVVLMCCISVAHGLRRGLVTSVQSRSSVDYSETTKGTVGTRAGQTAFKVRGELLQSLPQRQNTRSQEILKDTQEQSRASMSPEAMLVEVSEERPHILAGAPVIPETDLEEHELVQATATTTYYQGNAGTTCPPGQLITSQAECLNTAVNSLDVQAGSAWVGSALSIPVGCSIRRAGAANHNDFAPHWNRSPSGVGRADLNPICSRYSEPRITLHELGSSCAQAGPYTVWADESSDSQHGNVCFKPGGFKGGGVWACPVGCTKIHSVPWCIDDNDNTAPCRVPETLDPARCSSVVPGQGLESGSLSCQPRQDICIPTTALAWIPGAHATQVCKDAWKGVVECPDGFSSKGVFFPYKQAGYAGYPQEDVCAKWDSSQILLDGGSLACDESRLDSEGVYACTKATATHVHHASPASGMMVMKRIRCTRSADGGHDDCATFKVGICLDVGSNVFNHEFNDLNDMKTQTKAWLAKALPIVDGTAECPPNFPFKSGGLCYKNPNHGPQCWSGTAVKWCALSQKDFEDKTNAFGNCGSFCFACNEKDKRLTDRRIVAY